MFLDDSKVMHYVLGAFDVLHDSKSNLNVIMINNNNFHLFFI